MDTSFLQFIEHVIFIYIIMLSIEFVKDKIFFMSINTHIIIIRTVFIVIC